MSRVFRHICRRTSPWLWCRSRRGLGGWYQATKGFFIRLWSHLAKRDMYNSTKIDESMGSLRMRHILIQATYTHNLRTWISRNDMLHCSTNPQLADICSAESTEIRHIHGDPDCLCQADCHLCEDNLDSILGGFAFGEGYPTAVASACKMIYFMTPTWWQTSGRSRSSA